MLIATHLAQLAAETPWEGIAALPHETSGTLLLEI